MNTQVEDAVTRRRVLRDGPFRQYERMLEIRHFENMINRAFAEGLIHGTTHLCNGQEALAVGVATVLETDDTVTATYRGHGVALALGMSPRTVLAEIMGRTEGCTGGLGGSMHLSDTSVGLLPTFAIVGAGVPVAAGAALAYQCQGRSNVAVAVFGDGATNIGAFHEAMNLAAIWKLPVVFVCDNNVYGEYSRIDTTTPITDLYRRADSYAMNAEAIDGMDVGTVVAAVSRAVANARAGGGPTFIEAKTYRFAGHSRADKAEYRPAGELEAWQGRDPLRVAAEALRASGYAEADLEALDRSVQDRLELVMRDVAELPVPGPADMFKNVWAIGGAR